MAVVLSQNLNMVDTSEKTVDNRVHLIDDDSDSESIDSDSSSSSSSDEEDNGYMEGFLASDNENEVADDNEMDDNMKFPKPKQYGSDFCPVQDAAILSVFDSHRGEKERLFFLRMKLHINVENMRPYSDYSERYIHLSKCILEEQTSKKRKIDTETDVASPSPSTKAKRVRKTPVSRMNFKQLCELEKNVRDEFAKKIKSIEERREVLNSKLKPKCWSCKKECEATIIAPCRHVYCHECFTKQLFQSEKACIECEQIWFCFEAVIHMPRKCTVADCVKKSGICFN